MSRSSLSVSLSSEDVLDGFTILPNHVMDNKALSGDAKLIVWYLLRKTKSWEVQLPHLQKEFKLGRDGIRRVFRELNENGYATLVNLGKGADGKWLGSRWQIHVTRARPTPPPKIKGVGKSGGVNSSTVDNGNTVSEEKKCPPPSKTREIGLVSPEIKRIANELLNPSKRIPSAEHTSTAGKEQKRCALNCIVDLKLSRIPKGTMPSMEWLDEFVELYSPLWNADEINAYLLYKRRYQSVHDPEKYLTAFFEKMEDDRTGKRKAA